MSETTRNVARKLLPSVHVIHLDVTEWDRTREEITKIGPLDLLVNNAGVLTLAPFLETTKEVLDRIIDVNIKAAYNVAQRAMDPIDFVQAFSPDGARKMEEEKITSDLIRLMSDDELSKYIPVHGDRLRLRQHLTKETHSSTKKNKLLLTLSQKLKKVRKGEQSSEEEEIGSMRRPYGNRNAAKDTRLVEIGWVHKKHQRMKQVRSKTGGGTRKVDMRKNSKRAEILLQAKQLFFPGGKSPLGSFSDFDYDVYDFSQREIQGDLTIEQMYNETRMPVLRFYLATWDRFDDDKHDKGPVGQNKTEMEIDSESIHSNLSHSTKVAGDLLSTAIQMSGIDVDIISDCEDLPDPAINSHSDNDVQFLKHDSGNTVQEHIIDMEVHIIDMEEHIIDIDPPNNQGKVVEIRVHRGHVLLEMLRSFKSIEPQMDIINFEMIMPNGKIEIAEDGGGVTRDTLSEFWTEFYDQCTIGTSAKVPVLRHDFGEDEWAAVAKIILYGWKDQGYFPLRLSMPFMQQCIFGTYKEDLIGAFYQIVPEHERECLKTALDNFYEVDEDDLLEILETYEIRKQPNQQNISRLLFEIAHKEIIQKPKFISNCWERVLGKIDITENGLRDVYTSLLSTTKGVCKALTFPENMDKDEINVSNHLKRFIRGLNNEMLGKFVRFCTGSDLLVKKNN